MNKKYRVCIVGGGIVGTAIAYFLAKNGIKDIAVFEKNYISSGSTGRCAGGIRQQWSARPNVKLAIRSVQHFERFKEEVGMDIEYRQGGYLILSYDEEEAQQFEKDVKMQREEGLNVEILTPKMIKKRWDFINTDGVILATFCQKDGHANPHKANFGYAFAAKRMGVDIYTHTIVENIIVENLMIKGVKTSLGEFKCDVLVNAAGPWSRDIASMAGDDIPTTSYRHQIFVTEPLDDFFPFMAISFSGNFYMRQTLHGQFIMGQGDKDEKPGINRNVTFKFEKEMAKKMIKIFPFLQYLRILRHWSGEYNMSPDAQPIIGESEKIKGLIYAVGFSGHGFMLAPAVGEYIAQYIKTGKVHEDIRHLNANRFKEGIKEIEKKVV